MDELIFLKLGGSLITDKTQPYRLRAEKLGELAEEIRAARQRSPRLQLVLGHGSGSFGHQAAQEFGARLLSADSEKIWTQAEAVRGFAEIWYRASQLNRYVMEALHEAGLPAVAIQPSAAVRAADGVITHWDLAALSAALAGGLIPVIYGDIVFDAHKGGRILSTEDLMAHLARHIPPDRILLAGLEGAVWADFPARQLPLERITPGSYDAVSGKVGGSHGPDVTGGMKSKVEQMLALVRQVPGLSVQVFSGEQAGNLGRALDGKRLGTMILGD